MSNELVVVAGEVIGMYVETTRSNWKNEWT